MEEAISAERKRLETAAKVYKQFTQSLNQSMAVYDTGNAPEEYKLAKHINRILNNTLLSHLKGNIPAPSLPSSGTNTPASSASWASVAAKTTENNTTPLTGTQGPQGPQHPKITTPRTRPKKTDLRLFARLPTDSPMRKHTTFALVNALRKHMGTEGPRALKDVLRIPTGLALVPRDAQGQQILLSYSKEIIAFLSATALDLAQEWGTYTIQGVPDNISSFLDGEAQAITEIQVREEIAMFTQAKPTAVKASKAPRKNPGYQNMIVSFLAEEDPQWKRYIHLFGTTCLARKFEKKPAIVQCERCHGFHSTRTCIRI